MSEPIVIGPLMGFATHLQHSPSSSYRLLLHEEHFGWSNHLLRQTAGWWSLVIRGTGFQVRHRMIPLIHLRRLTSHFVWLDATEVISLMRCYWMTRARTQPSIWALFLSTPGVCTTWLRLNGQMGGRKDAVVTEASVTPIRPVMPLAALAIWDPKPCLSWSG